jgi:hypothetical protein
MFTNGHWQPEDACWGLPWMSALHSRLIQLKRLFACRIDPPKFQKASIFQSVIARVVKLFSMQILGQISVQINNARGY